MAKHALIIDDQVDNLRVLARLLEKEGLTYTEVDNPKNLVETVHKLGQLDIVFLDLELPGTDGYQIVRQLREMDQIDNTPIIAYTVHVSEMHVAHTRGFNGFISKPLNSGKFPDQLRRILNGEEVWETI